MNVFALIHEQALSLPYVKDAGMTNIEGVPVRVGLLEVPQPDFDTESSANTGYVQVQVEALSCNYRDKSLLMMRIEHFLSGSSRAPYAFIGSEFSGVVTAVGPGVTRWNVGDHVLPDAQYPEALPGVAPGIVTNNASAGWLRLHESKLVSRPEAMSSVQGAGFTLGAQTSKSMVRRAGVGNDDRVLVTSARSNTSLFLLAALQNTGASVWAASSSNWSDKEQELLQGAQLVRSSRKSSTLLEPSAEREIMDKGGFTAVLDPFFDLHLEKVVDLMAVGGRYVTCGLKDQHPIFLDEDNKRSEGSEERQSEMLDPLGQVMLRVMMSNLSLIGNCIGSTSDLEEALQVFEEGHFNVPVDSVYSPESADEFLHRTYASQERMGKVIMDYQR